MLGKIQPKCGKNGKLAPGINLMACWISRLCDSLSRRSSEKTTDSVIIGVTSGRFRVLSLGETSVSSVITGVTSDGIEVLSLRETSVNSVVVGTVLKGLVDSARLSPVIFSSESRVFRFFRLTNRFFRVRLRLCYRQFIDNFD